METRYKILIKYPSRGRKEKFFKGLDNIIANMSDKDNYRILCTLDRDDKVMTDPQTIQQLKPYLTKGNIDVMYGESKSKIFACNRDLMEYKNPWDIVILFSDDMVFTRPIDGFIREKFLLHFHDTDGALHLNDGYTQDKICTMIIAGRKYVHRFGYLYYPGYDSFCSDNEYTAVGRNLNKLPYFADEYYKHEHPCNTAGVASDPLYQYNDQFWGKDHDLLKSREEAGYPVQ